jgi:hypothetical protein
LWFGFVPCKAGDDVSTVDGQKDSVTQTSSWVHTITHYLRSQGHSVLEIQLVGFKADADWPEDDGAVLGVRELHALVACDEAGQALFDHAERLGIPYIRLLGGKDHSLASAPLYEWPDLIIAANSSAIPACLAEVPKLPPPTSSQDLHVLVSHITKLAMTGKPPEQCPASFHHFLVSEQFKQKQLLVRTSKCQHHQHQSKASAA